MHANNQFMFASERCIVSLALQEPNAVELAAPRIVDPVGDARGQHPQGRKLFQLQQFVLGELHFLNDRIGGQQPSLTAFDVEHR